ncbi:MAG: hypothetical protein CMK32_03695 [Porticoccaceae bacterium]|nr:hypothetical protein [Porticoccaceae bacterium]
MARVLCVWEMGSALGHLANLRPFVEAACGAGHQVTLAAKELQNIDAVLSGLPMTLFQAPYFHRQPRRRYPRLMSYSQLVLQRFESPFELDILCRAWNSIFDAVRPDLVIYDFAPSAMIASLGQAWQKWIVGSGFLVPRTDLPYLGLFPGVVKNPANARQLRDGEQRLLALVNGQLEQRGMRPLADVREIITQADQQLLLTLPELDHGGSRNVGDYLGIPPQLAGEIMRWPKRGACRVFAYLSAFPHLEKLLSELSGEAYSAVIYSRDIGDDTRARFPAIHFLDSPADMALVIEHADLVINMASHVTCAQCLMGGVPQLMIPLRQEQALLARRIADQGAGVILTREEDIAIALEASRGLAAGGRLTFDPERRASLSGPLLMERLERFFSVL